MPIAHRKVKTFDQSLFLKCKSISAKDAAERAGLKLKQRGTRYWAHCPLHEDKEPSMLFNDNGTFKCFSCNHFGDSVRLYELIHKVKPLEAANRLIADFGTTELASGLSSPMIIPRDVTVREFIKAVEDILWKRINPLLDVRYAAYERMRKIEENKIDVSELTEKEFDQLYAEFAKSSAADVMIDTIDSMSFQQKVDWIANGASIDEL